MNSQLHPQKLALIGERESGKTTLLLDLIKAFCLKRLDVAGIVSIGIFEEGVKVAIKAIDLESSESHILAILSKEIKTDLQYGDWSFYAETIEWANQRLATITHTDLFILDEIGPLELERDGGFYDGLSAMERENYRLGILTARPKCSDSLLCRFPELQILPLASWDINRLRAYILSLIESIP